MAVNCRIENKNPNPRSYDEREKSFKGMLAAFKNKVNRCGIMQTYKKYQSFEGKGRKRRRRKLECERLIKKGIDQDKVREYFG